MASGIDLPLTCNMTFTWSSGVGGAFCCPELVIGVVSSAKLRREPIARPLAAVPASKARRVTLDSTMFPPPLFRGVT